MSQTAYMLFRLLHSPDTVGQSHAWEDMKALAAAILAGAYCV